MILDINPAAGAAVIGAVVMVAGWLKDRQWMAVPGMIVFVIASMTYCEMRPERVAERRAEAAAATEAARLAAIPHVIREADGCKVYAFSAGGHEHFYTRCAESVTTERFYSVKVPCGKNCTRDEPRSEVIVTSKGP